MARAFPKVTALVGSRSGTGPQIPLLVRSFAVPLRQSLEVCVAALVTTRTPVGGLGLVLPRAILRIGAGVHRVPGHRACLPAGRHQVASI